MEGKQGKRKKTFSAPPKKDSDSTQSKEKIETSDSKQHKRPVSSNPKKPKKRPLSNNDRKKALSGNNRVKPKAEEIQNPKPGIKTKKNNRTSSLKDNSYNSIMGVDS